MRSLIPHDQEVPIMEQPKQSPMSPAAFYAYGVDLLGPETRAVHDELARRASRARPPIYRANTSVDEIAEATGLPPETVRISMADLAGWTVALPWDAEPFHLDLPYLEISQHSHHGNDEHMIDWFVFEMPAHHHLYGGRTPESAL